MGRFDNMSEWFLGIDFDGTIRQGTSIKDPFETWQVSPGFQQFNEWLRSTKIIPVLWTSRVLNSDTLDKLTAFAKKFKLEGIYYPTFETDIILFYPLHPKNLPVISFSPFLKSEHNKLYFDWYLDDLSIGCPKCEDGNIDWTVVKNKIIADLKIHPTVLKREN